MTTAAEPTVPDADRQAKCDAWAEDRGLIIDCLLPLGHDGDHDPGEIDWTMAPR